MVFVHLADFLYSLHKVEALFVTRPFPSVAVGYRVWLRETSAGRCPCGRWSVVGGVRGEGAAAHAC